MTNWYKMESNIVIKSTTEILDKWNFNEWLKNASVERSDVEGGFLILTDYDNSILTYTVEFDGREFPVYDFDVTPEQAKSIEGLIEDFLEYDHELKLAI